jgi:hypothetical protein
MLQITLSEWSFEILYIDPYQSAWSISWHGHLSSTCDTDEGQDVQLDNLIPQSQAKQNFAIQTHQPRQLPVFNNLLYQSQYV